MHFFKVLIKSKKQQLYHYVSKPLFFAKIYHFFPVSISYCNLIIFKLLEIISLKPIETLGY